MNQHFPVIADVFTVIAFLATVLNLIAEHQLYRALSLLIKKMKRGDEDLVQPVEPPSSTQYLFYFFLDAKTCDALVGDLEERYKLILKKFGKHHANFWYWSQAIRSTGPIAWQWFKKLVMKPVVTVMGSKIVHDLLKDTHLMEIVKTVLAEWLKRMRG